MALLSGGALAGIASAVHEHGRDRQTLRRIAETAAGGFSCGWQDGGLGGGPVQLTSSIAIFPEVVGNELDLIVKYQVADVSNTNQTYSSNVAVMKALLAKYPRDARRVCRGRGAGGGSRAGGITARCWR